MKRRLLSAFLAVMMVLTMAPVAFAADTETTTEYVAQVDGNKYETLADAIEAANDGDTITLLKGGNGNGFKVPEGKFTEQGLTIDFNQFTYMIGGQLVGSAGTGTNGCQLLKNNKITFKNGSFVGATEGSKPADDTPDWHGAPAIMIQNYCDLTLENMIVTGGDETVYTFSNNCGNTVIKDSTINAGKAKGYGSGPFAFDVCRYSTYPSVSVTVQGSSVINGDVEISGTIGEGQSRQLNIEDGTFNGRFIVSNTPANISITGGKFSSDVSAYVAEGYVQNEKNGTVEQLGETNAVAKVGDTYYKTLSAAVAVAKDGDTVTLLKNVVLNSTLTLNKNLTLDLNGCVISNGSELGTNYLVNIASGAKVSIVGDKANSKIADSRNNAKGTITAIIVYGNLTVSGDNLTISRGANGIAIKVEDNPGTLTVNSGTITVDAATVTSSQAIQNWGNATINGGVFNGDVDSYAYIAANKNYVGNMTIKNGIFNGEVFAAQLQYDNQWPTASARVAITGGNFKGIIAEYYHDSTKGLQPVENVSKPANTAESEVTVSGGYFTTDPSAYVASGYVAGTSDVSGYSYKVVAKTNTGSVEVKPAVAKPEVKVSDNIQNKEAVEAAAKTVSAPTLGAAAVDEAQKIDKSKADELVAKANKVTGDKKLYVQSALKVEPTAYDAANKTLALEITPQYRIVASTAATADGIELGVNGKNAEVVQDYTPMNITKATVVTMELPADFASGVDKLSIQHTKSNGTVEYYTGTVTEQSGKHLLTFTTNGFSPFVISVPAASIGENVYPTLQAAAENVKKNETIKLAKDVDEAIVVTVAKSINFKVDTNSKKFDAAKNIVAGSNTTVKVTGESSPYTYEFTYTKPSSGGSSGGSSSGKTTYKVTTSAVNNGGVNASPSNAEKGATITITLSPDKGYKLDKLTVTDGSGKTVSTVKKSDTVYTFTMPASAVKVGVSYVKATETPSETKFNDVSANDWFASAVDYVTGKGMMNGTAANTFSPKANTTRGMLMTVLARHAGEDTTGGSVWYEKGMNWAKANGVSDGTNPQVNITREQLAAMLYRYAQNKKYDVSGAKSLDGYTDAQSVSSYAVPALQWANAAGVVTGKSGSKLDPKGYATRAEVAAMLMRFCENVEK
nr:S-layer homology domain-containing protein [Butyricicoccus sp. TM10-16AC]